MGRTVTTALTAVALLVAGGLLPAATPVLCLSGSHCAVEGVLSTCRTVAPAGSGETASPGDDGCVDLALAVPLLPGTGPLPILRAGPAPGAAAPDPADDDRRYPSVVHPSLRALAAVVLLS